jgi:FkbM family methyltransferase
MLALPGTSPFALIPFQGTAVYGDLRDSGARMTLFLGQYYPQFTAIASAFLRHGGVYFDVGANIGFTSFSLLPVATESPIELHLFEANPECCRLLELSSQRIGHDRVFIVHCCVGATDGNARLTVPAGHNQDARVTETGELEVPVLRLDAYAASRSIETVSLMKLDVEGFEPEVLTGAEGLLNNGRIEVIFTELSVRTQAKSGFDAQTYLDRLRAFGYITFYCRDEDYAAGQPPHDTWLTLEIHGSRIRAAEATKVPSDCHTDILAIHQALFERHEVLGFPH